jgi:hypothetical protein
MSEPNWVVRSGIATPEQLKDGTSEHKAIAGLYGFSVQYQPGRSIQELAAAGWFPNRHISVATIEDLVAVGENAGYNVSVVKSPGRGYHHTIEVPYPMPDDLATALSNVFTQMLNPAPFPRP